MSSQFDKSGFRLPRNLRVHKPHHVSHPITELIFASPLEFRYSNDYEVIRVTHEMLALIQEGAEEYQDETSNGYCFGPLYDLDTYVFLGEHGVKGGTTGFIEVKAAKKKYHEGKKTNNFDTVCFPIKYNFPPTFHVWICKIIAKSSGLVKFSQRQTRIISSIVIIMSIQIIVLIRYLWIMDFSIVSNPKHRKHPKM